MRKCSILVPVPFFMMITLIPILGQVQDIRVSEYAGQNITLAHHQNDVSLEYVGIALDNPNGTKYSYRLEGLHNNWVDAGKERKARFENLPVGSYTFYVKAANSDGVWSEPTSVGLKILSPWWWTWRAKLAYFSILLGLIYGLHTLQLRRKLALAHVSRERELADTKSNLYTNITHEFRTPLTVIQGMASKIEGNKKATAAIQRNAANLLHLVNQMLDLSKLEAGSLPINFVQGDVVSYLSYLIESFQSLAQSKRIRLHFLPQMKVFFMDYDPDKLMKIVANLISNAIKFTEEGGDVYVMISHGNLIHTQPGRKPKIKLSGNVEANFILQIQDTGIGIESEELKHIFNRFYQTNHCKTIKEQGTGIGLDFTAELVKMLGGRIDVQSIVDQGSTFTILLPVTQEYSLAPDNGTIHVEYSLRTSINTDALSDNDNPLTDEDIPLALIVEDNSDITAYLKTCLKDRYRLVFATDGTSGLQMVKDLTPDIVISDVMMPKKDGFELCGEMKNDFRSSHIPVILLTAKADVDSRIMGLKKGADAYLTKPFNEEELLVRIEQLISNRQRLQKRYQKGITSISLHTKDFKYQLEDDFILNIQNAILDHLDDETFDTDKLCKHLGISASQLYRKLKALTGKSTAIYIRSIRLASAFELLRQTEKPVSEIAYEVGFKDAAYFSKCFSEEYGKSPRRVRE